MTFKINNPFKMKSSPVKQGIPTFVGLGAGGLGKAKKKNYSGAKNGSSCKKIGGYWDGKKCYDPNTVG